MADAKGGLEAKLGDEKFFGRQARETLMKLVGLLHIDVGALVCDWDAVYTAAEEALGLLAQAAYQHPDDEWAKSANALVPDLARHYSPPCPGKFNEPPFCDEYHVHRVGCGRPMDVCTLCGKINAEHRRT
ncbi:MAG: hypothetical protein IT405_03225 [Candidatus Yanofskybacteria bacterium]|nr:hypothetical protein [Candidatus Yanofskybacteria bacterium]